MKKPGRDEFHASASEVCIHPMSDHLPLGFGLQIDFAADDLDEVESDLESHFAI